MFTKFRNLVPTFSDLSVKFEGFGIHPLNPMVLAVHQNLVFQIASRTPDFVLLESISFEELAALVSSSVNPSLAVDGFGSS